MDIREYLRIWRTRWVTIAVTALACVVGALLFSAVSPARYAASTQLFIATSGGSSVSEAYQNNLFSTERVTSYANLATGRQVAQRTVDQMGIDKTATELIAQVKATPVPDSVLLDITVTDRDPALAADLANTVGAQLSQLIKELETSARGGAPAAGATLVELADVPSSPVSPNWMRNILLGLIGGLLLGLMTSVLREKFDRSVRTPEGLSAIAGVPVVGAIPVAKGSEDAGVLFGADHPMSSEAFRDLRTNLQFLGADNPPRAFVVAGPDTSADPSTVVASLGLALSEVGYSVLLVDANLRTPALAQRFGLDSSVGLSTVLANQVHPDQAVQATPHNGLRILPAGAVASNPSELLNSPVCADLFKRLRGEYDLVLVDAPPILPYTDAALLVNNTDGALLVARRGKTTREDIEHALTKLRLVGASVLGAVLTDAPDR